MSGIKGKNTKPELVLRRALHARGFRYRLHSSKVYGRPDIVLPKYNSVIFVHGCFWHRHEGCRYATTPSTRVEFWQAKFNANLARDRTALSMLLKDGWRVATVWECALRRSDQVDLVAQKLAAWLTGDKQRLELDGPTVTISC
ncbi:very short patch repair endonuclease [Ruegeria sp. HKCCA4008]|uniref:very short patch repair endonuclease n=1 Tax=Ruegeria sp. HKCCA4008 TaxID=2682999 RepID=UPI00352FFE99